MKSLLLLWLLWLLTVDSLAGFVGALLEEDSRLSFTVSEGHLHHDKERSFCPNMDKPDDCFKFMDGVASLTSIIEPEASFATAFGFSEYAHKIPMPIDAHFPIASNSKLYTTVAIYQLHEQGKLDVKADIATMLDKEDFANFGWSSRHGKLCPRLPFSFSCQKITLEHLMSMSSGIYPELNCDAIPNSLFSEHPQCNPVPYFINPGSIGAVIGTFLDQPLIFRPGTKFHYSNPNFVLAAYFVEKYSGLTFRDYLSANVIAKIGLSNATTYYDFFDQALQLDNRRVQEYFKFYDNETAALLSVGTNKLQLDLGVASSTGGIISTLADQVTFWHTVFNKTTAGAPLFQDACTLTSILQPLSLVSQGKITWKDTIIDVWQYYAQGVVIVCTAPKCPTGPRWIIYQGGTMTVHTANAMDYETYDMSQVWSTSIVLMTNAVAFDKAFARQQGESRNFAEWVSPELNDNMRLAFRDLFRYRPPTAVLDMNLDIDESLVT